jgi:hypothetical protein
MSRLYNQHSGELRRTLAYDALYLPAPAEIEVPDHDALYHHAAVVVGRHEPVTYLEFGVAEGKSLRKMTQEFEHPDSIFVGFDSFVGLPEAWMMHVRVFCHFSRGE